MTRGRSTFFIVADFLGHSSYAEAVKQGVGALSRIPHVTILPAFYFPGRTPKRERYLALQILQPLAGESLLVELGERRQFGRTEGWEVISLTQPTVQALHHRCLQLAKSLGAHMGRSDIVSGGYRPHVSDYFRTMEKGAQLEIYSFSMVERTQKDGHFSLVGTVYPTLTPVT